MKSARPKVNPRLAPQVVGDDPARAVSDIAEAVSRLEGQRAPRDPITADLVVGANRLNHGLGRKPQGCTVTPTVADATFGWALTERSEKTLVITVVGTGQPGATVEVF